MTLTFDLLTPKSIGHILDSWWVSVWSFMIIGWLQSQLSSGNHFQITMRHDLDLWPFDPKINRAHPWLMGSKCIKFHDHRWITESVIIRKLVWRTDGRTDGQTECKPIVPSGFTGGGLINNFFLTIVFLLISKGISTVRLKCYNGSFLSYLGHIVRLKLHVSFYSFIILQFVQPFYTIIIALQMPMEEMLTTIIHQQFHPFDYWPQFQVA